MRGSMCLKARSAVCHNQAILAETEFQLNGALAELERLEAEISSFCQSCALSGEVAFDLNLALEELFTNAVRHGGCEGMDDAVHIRLRRQTGGVRVEFADRGRAFDPATAPAPNLDAPRNERRPGGLGIHLVRQLMQELRYERAGEWNRITMWRPAPEAAGQS